MRTSQQILIWKDAVRCLCSGMTMLPTQLVLYICPPHLHVSWYTTEDTDNCIELGTSLPLHHIAPTTSSKVAAPAMEASMTGRPARLGTTPERTMQVWSCMMQYAPLCTPIPRWSNQFHFRKHFRRDLTHSTVLASWKIYHMTVTGSGYEKDCCVVCSV
jgi:hypothetical protein